MSNPLNLYSQPFPTMLTLNLSYAALASIPSSSSRSLTLAERATRAAAKAAQVLAADNAEFWMIGANQR